jgi:hypothetical protein
MLAVCISFPHRHTGHSVKPGTLKRSNADMIPHRKGKSARIRPALLCSSRLFKIAHLDRSDQNPSAAKWLQLHLSHHSLSDLMKRDGPVCHPIVGKRKTWDHRATQLCNAPRVGSSSPDPRDRSGQVHVVRMKTNDDAVFCLDRRLCREASALRSHSNLPAGARHPCCRPGTTRSSG